MIKLNNRPLDLSNVPVSNTVEKHFDHLQVIQRKAAREDGDVLEMFASYLRRPYHISAGVTFPGALPWLSLSPLAGLCRKCHLTKFAKQPTEEQRAQHNTQTLQQQHFWTDNTLHAA